ncbi:MAG: radical SAM protein [Alphaproteobacteria bacterium]|nr:radical SAM protein [Alphaproteobacteria bacterium]
MNIAIIFYRTLSSQSAASLSAGYIAANLKRIGYNAKLFLLKKEEDYNDIKPIISDTVWDIIFYKPNFKDYDRIEKNLENIKKHYPKAKVILFGPLAYINQQKFINKFSEIEGIMCPDAEVNWNSYSDILTSLIKENYVPNMQNNNIYVCSPSRDIEIAEDLKIANIEASRWCRRQCAFCHVGLISKLAHKKIWIRTPEEVVDEIIELKKINKKYFIFNDPVLCGGGENTKKWINKFHELIKNNSDIFFMAYLTLNDIKDKSFIRYLENANFIRVFVGIESAQKETLHLFNKGIDVNNYFEIKKTLKKHNIIPHIGFMVFHPYVTVEEIKTNLFYLHKNDELHRFGVVFEPTRIIYNTPLYNKALKDNLLDLSDDIKISYSFYNKDVQEIFNRFRKIFGEIDVPLFERIEHLFVTSEFIDNMVKKVYSPSKEYKNSYQNIKRYRKKYSSDFLKLSLDIIENIHIDTSKERKKFFKFWQKLENVWADFIFITKKLGFSNPLEWIASGNCNPEPIKDENYTGKCLETRSGRIRVEC